MKLVLISDSHGKSRAIKTLFDSVNFDYLFFLGDGIDDLKDYITHENVIAVSGNCDFFSTTENEKIIELGGHKIFVTHGNKYGVKGKLSNLLLKAREIGADMVFYGHTHRKSVEQINGIYFINPGKFADTQNNYNGLIVEFENNDVKITDLQF